VWARPTSFAFSNTRIAVRGRVAAVRDRAAQVHSRTPTHPPFDDSPAYSNLGLLKFPIQGATSLCFPRQGWNAGGCSPKKARRPPVWVLRRAATHRGSRRNAEPRNSFQYRNNVVQYQISEDLVKAGRNHKFGVGINFDRWSGSSFVSPDLGFEGAMPSARYSWRTLNQFEGGHYL